MLPSVYLWVVGRARESLDGERDAEGRLRGAGKAEEVLLKKMGGGLKQWLSR